MRLRPLLLPLPFALVLYLAARLLLGTAADRPANLAAFALAAAGCVAAARGLGRGDYLRTAWYLQGASYLILVVAAALVRPDAPQGVLVARFRLILVANLLGVAGTVLFARAHRVAGLPLPWSPRARRLFMAAVAALALAAAGPPFVLQLGPALDGDLTAASGAVSSLADVITLALVAPLFMTAVALRGGLLVWPWALYTAATVTWLVYDAQDTVAWLAGIGEEPLRVVTVPLRIVACALTFAAGLAQRRLSTAARVDSSARAG